MPRRQGLTGFCWSGRWATWQPPRTLPPLRAVKASPGRGECRGPARARPRTRARFASSVEAAGRQAAPTWATSVRPKTCTAYAAAPHRTRAGRLPGRIRRARTATGGGCVTGVDLGDLSRFRMQRFSRVAVPKGATSRGLLGSRGRSRGVMKPRICVGALRQALVSGDGPVQLWEPLGRSAGRPVRTLAMRRRADRVDQVWLSLLIAGIHASSGLSTRRRRG
jgi:hypothetical protein